MSAFIAWSNLADLGSVIADGAVPTLPASHLQTVHVAQIWRSQAAPTWILLDMSVSKPINLVALCGVAATDETSFRVRVGDDPDFATAAYDSDALIGLPHFDPAFRTFAHILAEDIAGRYVRIDIADDGLDYIQAGRLIVSQGFRPRVNFSFGAGRSVVSLSKQSQSRGGQIYIDIGPKYRRWTMTFSSLDETEAQFFERRDLDVATDGDVFFCAKERSDNLGRDSIFGLIEAPTEINNRAFRIYSKSLSIKERL